MTTRYAAKHGPNLINTLHAIADRKPFNAGNLTGGDFHSTGIMPSDLARSVRDDAPDYVVYSYSTPIAWHGSRGWIVPARKYSVTTSNHQGVVRRALDSYTEV